MEGSERKTYSLGMLVGVAAVAAGIGAGYAEWRVRAVEDELQVSPRIAVLPVYDTIKRKAEDGASAEEAAKAPMAAAKRLADQGFVVLDADRVYAYPAPLEVRP
jgi:hypothetical protein